MITSNVFTNIIKEIQLHFFFKLYLAPLYTQNVLCDSSCYSTLPCVAVLAFQFNTCQLIGFSLIISEAAGSDSVWLKVTHHT